MREHGLHTGGHEAGLRTGWYTQFGRVMRAGNPSFVPVLLSAMAIACAQMHSIVSSRARVVATADSGHGLRADPIGDVSDGRLLK